MRTILLAALVALAASSTACDQASTGSDGEAAGPSSQPSWLMGTWSWSEWGERAGDDKLDGEHLTLEADGSATHSIYVGVSTVDHRVRDHRSTDRMKWSASATTIDIGKSRLPLFATPNCRLLLVGDKTFSHDEHEPPGCPFTVAPLTDVESSLVGTWKFLWPPTDDSAVHSLSIGEDRHLHITTNPHLPPSDDWPSNSVSAYYTVDADNVLHGVQPGGEENLTLQLEPYSGGRLLRMCAGRCTTMKRQ